jgi:membrane protein insertase Oxa1/YidC/SpoIIIJ
MPPIKMGGDTGASDPNSFGMKLFSYGMPAITCVIFLSAPAGLNLSFLIGAIFSFLQAFLFRQPLVRRLLDLHPLPPKRLPEPASGAAGSRLNIAPTYQAPTSGYALPSSKQEHKSALEKYKADLRKFVDEGKVAAEKATAGLSNKNAKKNTPKARAAKAYEERRQQEIKEERERHIQSLQYKAPIKKERGGR